MYFTVMLKLVHGFLLNITQISIFYVRALCSYWDLALFVSMSLTIGCRLEIGDCGWFNVKGGSRE